MTNAPPAVEIRGLTKRFLGTLALDHVDLTIGRGEILALVGENGAGKSTLIKTLAGIHQPDAGEILIEGKTVHPYAESVPIAFVHQDLGLVDELSIGENVALVAGFPRKGGLISWSRVWSQTEIIYAGMGIEPPDPRAPVGSLSAASKAILGIARALSRQARIVVLDEPTASLPGPDALHLFELLLRLRASGTSILYVSHRLNELFGLVDRVTVFRDGRHVRSSPIGTQTPETIVHDMLGRDLDLHHGPQTVSASLRPMLTVSDLRVENQGPLSFSVGQGEVLGLVGLRGGGHEVIGRTIFGTHSQDAGTIRLAEENISPDLPIAGRIAKGIALLAGERLVESAFPGMSLRENLFPNKENVEGGLLTPISRTRENEQVRDVLERFDVRPPGWRRANRLAQRRQSTEGLRRPLARDRRSAVHHGGADCRRRHRRQGHHSCDAARHRGQGRGGSGRVLGFRGGRGALRPRPRDWARRHYGRTRRQRAKPRKSPHALLGWG